MRLFLAAMPTWLLGCSVLTALLLTGADILDLTVNAPAPSEFMDPAIVSATVLPQSKTSSLQFLHATTAANPRKTTHYFSDFKQP